ncbi:glycine betaine ABC transporter substrate-binding protein [Paraburkholderia sp. 22B1P]|uniref:glycine betaine ABC transporter substrate-binding protein n=1 Tax=Paraburkholderia sp. 22B1P TaxID=3080498 RepID=UPI00308FD786|nr:glycine betaine ABC transporter substrate-binding protein [Paraburkholderia sp. 22B1P]
MNTIRLGYIDLSFHAASAAVVQRVLERDGNIVESIAAPHEAMFKKYGSREVDMLVSAWLPGSHGAYLEPYVEDTRYLGVLYEPYCIWGVPDFVPAEIVSSVRDLTKPEVAQRMEKLIRGINPGAGISRFSKEIISAYALEAHGYYFETGDEEGCYSRFEDGVARNTWMVIPLWKPQFLHYRYRIRELTEPRGLLRGRDKAILIAHASCVKEFSPQLLTTLTSLSLGNEVVATLDYWIRREGMSALAAADRWLSSTRGI